MPTKGLLPEQTKICLHLHCADGIATPRLARMLHSLVRVSRRVGCSHLDTNNCSTRRDHSPHRADIRQRTLQAVPGAVPKRKEVARPRRACTASVKVHNSPQSPPDCQTDGCKFHLEEEATCPTVVGQLPPGVQSSRPAVQPPAPYCFRQPASRSDTS